MSTSISVVENELLDLAPRKIRHSYKPYGGCKRLWRTFHPEVLLVGAAGTGKTRAILERINELCLRFPGVRALICRETREACTESILVTLERDVLSPTMPGMQRQQARNNRQHYEYANGSLIVVGGLDKPEKLYSTEWDIVYVAEAIETTEHAWELFARAMRNHAIPLGARSRGPKKDNEEQALDPDGRPLFWTQRIADTNPGAPGHWLNRRAGKRSAGKRMARLKTFHTDNPSLSADYLDGLRALTGHRRARLFEGRWVAGDNVVYGEFDESRHVVAPFAVPRAWPWWVAFDPGRDHPAAVLWFTLSPNHTLYVADEVYGSGLSLGDIAKAIHERNEGRAIQAMYADPRMAFNHTMYATRSIAEQMQEDHGLTFQEWPRRQGKGYDAAVEEVRSLLIAKPPRLKVFSTNHATINEFETWPYKRDLRGELPPGDDRYEDRDNHAMDCIRGVVTLGIYRMAAVEQHEYREDDDDDDAVCEVTEYQTG